MEPQLYPVLHFLFLDEYRLLCAGSHHAALLVGRIGHRQLAGRIGTFQLHHRRALHEALLRLFGGLLLAEIPVHIRLRDVLAVLCRIFLGDYRLAAYTNPSVSRDIHGTDLRIRKHHHD